MPTRPAKLASNKKYLQSPKGKLAARKARNKWRQSPKGREITNKAQREYYRRKKVISLPPVTDEEVDAYISKHCA